MARAWSCVVFLTFLFLFVCAGALLAAPAPKVGVCHFQADTGTWTLLTIGASAVPAHLAHHDDALPGGTTTQTQTALDDACGAVPCPCTGLTSGATVWDATFFADTCGLTSPVFTLTLENSVTGSTLSVSGAGVCTITNDPETPPTSVTGLSVLEVNACALSLRQIAGANVSCPVPVP